MTEPQERPLARTIVEGVRSYIRDYSKPLVATARRDPAAAASIVGAGEGKRRVDAMRAEFGTLVALETGSPLTSGLRQTPRATGRRARASPGSSAPRS